MNRKLDKMEDLLANKSYQDLLPEEKEWVGQQYSADEYNGMRHAMLQSSMIFKQERTKPNPEIKSMLRQRLKQSKEPTKVAPLFLYRIPAWQAVAAFALLLFFIPQMQENQSSDPDQIFIYHTDTVFKESPVEAILNPIIDTVSAIPQVRNILNRTNRSPIKSSTIVFSKDPVASADLSRGVSDYFASNHDSLGIEQIITRYLKDSVKGHRVDVDTGFLNMGRVY